MLAAKKFEFKAITLELKKLVKKFRYIPTNV